MNKKHYGIRDSKGTMLLVNKSHGKKTKTDYTYVASKQNIVDSVVFDKSGVQSVVIKATFDQIENMLKEAKKRNKRLKSGGINCLFAHLSPDVSFLLKKE